MELLKSDTKLPKMIMCGDHPSITKTELNLKEMKVVESKDKDRKLLSTYARVSPTSSRTERPLLAERAPRSPALRARSADSLPRDAPGTRELLQAALVSFRWPPYLLAAWLLLLLAAHALHALAAALAAALPPLRELCQYVRSAAEASWGGECGARGDHVRGALLIVAAALLYALRGALLAAHALLRWALEPLASDDDVPGARLPKVTDYGDDFEIKAKAEEQ